MEKLNKIEKLRKELAVKVSEITDIPLEAVDVSVSLTSTDDSDLAIEARDLGWFIDRHKESAWYTTEIPQGGTTTIFVE